MSSAEANQGLGRANVQSFMHYLKYHRLSLGLTQSDVAKRAHISQAAYNSYERGLKRPGPKQHTALADALERPIEEFMAKLYRIDTTKMVVSSKSQN